MLTALPPTVRTFSPLRATHRRHLAPTPVPGPMMSRRPDQPLNEALASRQALPELRVPEPDWLSLRHLAQRACPRCTARHQGSPVRRLFTHYEYLCTRHGYWTGPPDPSRDEPPRPLAAQVPELAAAQRTLSRTRRLHGWAATFNATAAATSI